MRLLLYFAGNFLLIYLADEYGLGGFLIYAVLSDIHANLAALKAVLKDAEDQGARAFWSLGDVVGYGPQPNECLEELQKAKAFCIAGDHERACLDDWELGALREEAAWVIRWTRERLSKPHLDLLNSWPYTPQKRGRRFTLVHGSLQNPLWEYIAHWHTAKGCFKKLSTQFCLVGHTHFPRVFQEIDDDSGAREITDFKPDQWYPLGEGRLILNPGSVGQPRDGDWRAAYLLLDLRRNRYCLRRVEYPIKETLELMKSLKFPDLLIRYLGRFCS